MYDVVIIGWGASGLTTALYTARANLKTLIVEKGIYGGQLQNTAEIENYSGFGNISGEKLADNMYNQAVNHGAEYMYGEVTGIGKLEDDTFEIKLEDSESIYSKSVVIATGVKHRKLGVEGEDEFIGRGVSYCALCDGAFFQNKVVAVVGGGDSALEEANYLAQFADSVVIIHRRNEFRGQAILQDRVKNNPKILTVMNYNVVGIDGKNSVQEIHLINNDENSVVENAMMLVDGVFIYVGLDPITEPFKELGILDENGYIITDHQMRTSIDGLFAVGDVRVKDVRQVATAVGDGAIAGVEVNKFLESIDKNKK